MPVGPYILIDDIKDVGEYANPYKFEQPEATQWGYPGLGEVAIED
jgi:hypothetical protein